MQLPITAKARCEPDLGDVGQLTQVELVVELDSRRQEVVHDMAVQLN